MTQLQKPPHEADVVGRLRRSEARTQSRKDSYVFFGPRDDAPYGGEDGPRVVVGLLSDGTHGVEVFTQDGGQSTIQSDTLVSYTEFTTAIAVAATVEASATTIITAPQLDADGSAMYEFEFFTPQIQHSADGDETHITLFDGAAAIGELTDWQSRGAGSVFLPMTVKRRFTPTMGTHTFSVRAWKAGGGTNSINGGVGGAGTLVPGYLKITKL